MGRVSRPAGERLRKKRDHLLAVLEAGLARDGAIFVLSVSAHEKEFPIICAFASHSNPMLDRDYNGSGISLDLQVT